jgi:hypothetical protein
VADGRRRAGAAALARRRRRLPRGGLPGHRRWAGLGPGHRARPPDPLPPTALPARASSGVSRGGRPPPARRSRRGGPCTPPPGSPSPPPWRSP